MKSKVERPPVESEVERKLASLWNTEAERATAERELLSYGAGESEREAERVRLAILKLSNGSLDELKAMVSAAKADYRDVLAWAEYPEQSKAQWSSRANLSEAERKKLKGILERDRRQYDEWRKK